MPLISKSQEQLLDPLSEKISEKLSSLSQDFVIDRFRLRAFVYARAKRTIMNKHPDWMEENKIRKETLERLIDFNVRLDYNSDLQKIVAEFISLCKEEEENPEFPARVVQQEESQKILFEREMTETQSDKNVDKPVPGVSGRRTQLHIACEEGDFNKVVHLIEKCGAKINIRDASNWTPKDRAIFCRNTDNHAKIIAYLDNFS